MQTIHHIALASSRRVAHIVVVKTDTDRKVVHPAHKKKRSNMAHYIVMTASAKVSGKARQFGRYGHASVVEVETADTVPAMISERAKGVVRIVWDSGACSIGKTDRSAFAVAKAHATAMAARLNA
jgi:hypothetical protein